MTWENKEKLEQQDEVINEKKIDKEWQILKLEHFQLKSTFFTFCSL